MRKHLLSYANVMSTLAFFLALGGVSYAAIAIPLNSVGTKQIIDKSVGATDLADRSVTSAKLDNAVVSLFKGQKGDRGPQGAQGDIGLQGSIGLTGPQGDTGVQGPKGDLGATGARGPAGADGVGSVRIFYVEQNDAVTSENACFTSQIFANSCATLPYLPSEWTAAPDLGVILWERAFAGALMWGVAEQFVERAKVLVPDLNEGTLALGHSAFYGAGIGSSISSSAAPPASAFGGGGGFGGGDGGGGGGGAW
jgi:hypothetical protein